MCGPEDQGAPRQSCNQTVAAVSVTWNAPWSQKMFRRAEMFRWTEEPRRARLIPARLVQWVSLLMELVAALLRLIAARSWAKLSAALVELIAARPRAKAEDPNV